MAWRNSHLLKTDWEWIGWVCFHKEQVLNAVTEVLFPHAAVAVADAVVAIVAFAVVAAARVALGLSRLVDTEWE